MEGLVLIIRCTLQPACSSTTTKPAHHDFEVWLEKLARKSRTASTGTTDMRTMPTLISNADHGRETTVAITNGKLDLGTWEQIFYYEFDGKRASACLLK
jgi:thiamine phosphate synthase YjbQ (UPF0047 family)